MFSTIQNFKKLLIVSPIQVRPAEIVNNKKIGKNHKKINN